MSGACSIHFRDHMCTKLWSWNLYKRPVQRPKFRWRGTIFTHLTETAWDGLWWVKLAHEMDQRWALVTRPWIPIQYKAETAGISERKLASQERSSSMYLRIYLFPPKINIWCHPTKQMSQAVKFATLFREMMGSNLGQYTEKCEIQRIMIFYSIPIKEQSQ